MVLPVPNKYDQKKNKQQIERERGAGVGGTLTGPKWRIKVADYDVNTMKDFWHTFWFGFSFITSRSPNIRQYKTGPKSRIFQQVEAHSVAGAESAITCYEQLLSMFH